MANLNLSEFTEKLFVADADHTFIWDSAMSISKRVSRNSWLNSGTLTSDAPVTISQTWNQIGTAFTAFKVNAVSTASASGSLLLDLQVGGVSQFTVRKDGAIVLPFGYAGIIDGSVNGGGTNYTWGGPRFGPTAFIAWTATSPAGTADTILLRDGAANTLALRNGAAAQTFRVYKSYLNAGVDYERLSFSHDGVQFGIGTERAGSGIAQPLRFFGGSSAALDFANGVSFRNASGGTTFMTVASSGNVGIGTTAPGSNLSVVGNMGVRNAATGLGTGYGIEFDTNSSLPRFSFVFNSTYSSVIEQLSDTLRIKTLGTTTNLTLGSNSVPGQVVLKTDTGNLGIGTTSPTSKLQVSAGDVEVDTIAKGVILKSPDGTRYRVTVANGGTLSVAAV